MYDLHYEPEHKIVFIHHKGTFERAEHFTALLDLASKFTQINAKRIDPYPLPMGIWLDTKDVSDCSLADTDAAFGNFAYRKFLEAGAIGVGIKFVRVLYPDSPAYATLLERSQRRNQSFNKRHEPSNGAVITTEIPTFDNTKFAKRFVGLPEDYRIDWPKLQKF